VVRVVIIAQFPLVEFLPRSGYNPYRLCRHNYGHRNLGHGRFRLEVLRHWYFYMMGVIGCVHKLNSRMFYSAELGEILLKFSTKVFSTGFNTDKYSCRQSATPPPHSTHHSSLVSMLISYAPPTRVPYGTRVRPYLVLTTQRFLLDAYSSSDVFDVSSYHGSYRDDEPFVR
jgi:hypothetical protein